MSRGPHSQLGHSVWTSMDFIMPGGTLMRSRLTSPRVTASRCSQIASIAHPRFIARPGSSTGHIISA